MCGAGGGSEDHAIWSKWLYDLCLLRVPIRERIQKCVISEVGVGWGGVGGVGYL